MYLPLSPHKFAWPHPHPFPKGSVMEVVLASQLIPATSRILAMMARRTKVTKTNKKRNTDLVGGRAMLQLVH